MVDRQLGTNSQSGLSLIFDNADFYAIAETQTPSNILKQPKAKLITNPLINKLDETPVDKKSTPKTNIEVFNTFIRSFVLVNYETMNDIINKPDNVPLFDHVGNSINKRDRKLYVGILLILIAILFFS